jgi:hypothetical protein
MNYRAETVSETDAIVGLRRATVQRRTSSGQRTRFPPRSKNRIVHGEQRGYMLVLGARA